MNESTLVSREEMSDLDWLARNVHEWPRITPKVISAGDELFEFGATFYNDWADIYGKFAGCGATVTKQQWLARRAELQKKPSWSGSPEWAQFLGQDEDGVWYWHGERPNEKGEDVNGQRYWMSRGISDIACRGELLGDWRDTLERRPERAEFEPFVSVEDVAPEKKRVTLAQLLGRTKRITPSKYTKTIHGVPVDVYDVLQAWGVINPALQHLIKKALQCGQRGHKDNAQDLQDIIDSAIRAKELEC